MSPAYRKGAGEFRQRADRVRQISCGQPGVQAVEEVRRKEARQDAQAREQLERPVGCGARIQRADGGGARTWTQLRTNAGHGAGVCHALELQKAYASGTLGSAQPLSILVSAGADPNAYAFCSSRRMAYASP